jgi:ribulose bisphosphate carboxylase small subunit
VDAWLAAEAHLLEQRCEQLRAAQECHSPHSPEYIRLVRAESHLKQAIEILEEDVTI